MSLRIVSQKCLNCVDLAFDCVDTEILLNTLENYGVDDNFVDWIQEFLANRNYIVTAGNESSNFTTSDSLPQGSVLSPLLFNIYTTKLHESTSNTTVLQFVDDITLLVSARRGENLSQKCNCAIDNFVSKLDSLKLSVNPEKCKVLKFLYFDVNKNKKI